MVQSRLARAWARVSGFWLCVGSGYGVEAWASEDSRLEAKFQFKYICDPLSMGYSRFKICVKDGVSENAYLGCLLGPARAARG